MNTKQKSKKSESKTKPTTVPTLKQLCKLISCGKAPGGLKVKKNEADGYTFSYGPKSAPISIIASVDEVVAVGLTALGLKLS